VQDIFFNREDVGKNFLQSAQTNPYNSWRYISGDYISGDYNLHSQQNDSMVSGNKLF
jgi:hypothetical protein